MEEEEVEEIEEKAEELVVVRALRPLQQSRRVDVPVDDRSLKAMKQWRELFSSLELSQVGLVYSSSGSIGSIRSVVFRGVHS